MSCCAIARKIFPRTLIFDGFSCISTNFQIFIKNVKNYKNLLDNLSKNQNISNKKLELGPFFYSEILKLEGFSKINNNKLNINDTESKDKELKIYRQGSVSKFPF